MPSFSLRLFQVTRRGRREPTTPGQRGEDPWEPGGLRGYTRHRGHEPPPGYGRYDRTGGGIEKGLRRRIVDERYATQSIAPSAHTATQKHKMDRDLLHKTATRIAPAGETKTESNGNGNGTGKGSGSKAASNNDHASEAAAADNNNGNGRTPKKRRKVNHGSPPLHNMSTALLANPCLQLVYIAVDL
ncbi:uncharacterized protein SPSK_00276 [Sporothrix schenckii 1099-18]|uniref:Uncharacterized protein n=1 Tax=Sporothrix schenckii 1099-18 TaxID=1397361 RepID=A0A0F2M5A4_SPOSC|nr:uncharacterized protein SPSK_00276 [Sporothrix schenckii 1099-18]KJR83955.1 hypothetical protein SPSK_00276 [Sporothrix schenckii 1099-18]